VVKLSVVRNSINGWVVCHKGKSPYRKAIYQEKYKYVWIVKASPHTNGKLDLGTVNFPERFIGKRILFKIIVLEDNNEMSIV